jgi:hypothetical protein
VIELTMELGIKNPVVMRCGNDTGMEGEAANVSRRQPEPFQKRVERWHSVNAPVIVDIRQTCTHCRGGRLWFRGPGGEQFIKYGGLHLPVPFFELVPPVAGFHW